MTTLASRLSGAPAVRFVLVGGSNVAIGFAIVWVGVRLPFESRFKAGIAQMAAYAVGSVWSFLWNRHWTFRSTDAKAAHQALRFAATQVGLAVTSSTALSFAVDRQHWPLAPCWFVVTAVMTATNFLLSRYWVFR